MFFEAVTVSFLLWYEVKLCSYKVQSPYSIGIYIGPFAIPPRKKNKQTVGLLWLDNWINAIRTIPQSKLKWSIFNTHRPLFVEFFHALSYDGSNSCKYFSLWLSLTSILSHLYHQYQWSLSPEAENEKKIPFFSCWKN